MPHSEIKRLILAGLVVMLGVLGYACAPSGKSSNSTNLLAGDAASRVYVAPGSYDSHYAFLSGGFSGQVTVYGLPSGRLFKQIPVFSQYPQTGYGYSEETKPMLATTFGQIPWDDSHHTELSLTDGVPDGRWLFINANNTPRIARIDLRKFETEEIIQIPNAAGGHASPFATPDTKYVVSATRFSVPIPQADVPIDSYKKNFKGTLTFVTANQPGKMDVAFQIMMPGKVVVVELNSDAAGNYFKPSKFEAHRGDVIRFTLKSGVHNVHFLPDSNGGRSNLPAASEMLQLPDQALDIPVNFEPGTYYFQCDPHAALGMMGHVKVED